MTTRLLGYKATLNVDQLAAETKHSTIQPFCKPKICQFWSQSGICCNLESYKILSPSSFCWSQSEEQRRVFSNYNKRRSHSVKLLVISRACSSLALSFHSRAVKEEETVLVVFYRLWEEQQLAVNGQRTLTALLKSGSHLQRPITTHWATSINTLTTTVSKEFLCNVEYTRD